MANSVAKSRSNQIDMLNGPLLGKMLLFALPLAASSILQQLFNAADVAVVGRFAGSEALAAVSSNTPIINLLVNLFVGISVGANVVISRLIGQKQEEKISSAVHTAMLIAIISGIAMVFVGCAIAGPMLTMMGSPDDVRPLATLYLRIYFCGMPFVMLYNFGAAVLRSKGDTKRPVLCLMVSGVINVILNLVLVILFHMSVSGVAIATVTANFVSSAMIVYFLMHEEEPIRFYPQKLRLHKTHLMNILRIGAPAGLQGMVFSFSNVFIQTAINGFDTHAVAGSGAAFNFECFTYFFISAFNQATVTFTSQNFGAGNIDRCKRVFRVGFLSSLVFSILCSATIVLLREYIVLAFTTDPMDIEYAMIRTLHVAVFTWMMTIYELPGAAMRGLGHSLLPAILTILGVCAFRLLWVETVFVWYGSFQSLLLVYPASWALTGVAVFIAYFIVRRRAFAHHSS